MKWNFYLALVTFTGVFLVVAIPNYLKLKAMVELTSTPPGAAFLVAVIFAGCAALSVFVVSYLLQRYGFVL